MHNVNRFFSSVVLLLLLLAVASCKRQKGTGEFPTIPFDRNENRSADYGQTIGFYELMASMSPYVSIREIGPSDAGKPLHEVVITRGRPDPASVRSGKKIVIMINNGIHGGEPCGIDASMLLTRDLVREADKNDLLDHVAVVILPVYNIGGALRRNSTTRANQNGPEEYGFRGNAKNLDLNRDFIKCDSRNAETFTRWFAQWQPELFIDTHTSNGADYSYVMTLIETQKDKLSQPLAEFMSRRVTPELYQSMERSGYEMTPYVYSRGTPDEGIYGFLDLPRYSTGLAALHQTIGYTTEAHMLKPFADRVKATRAFLGHAIDIAEKVREHWFDARRDAERWDLGQDSMDIDWILDLDRKDSLRFHGYQAGYKPSEVTGKDRLYYDPTDPYRKYIPYWPHYKSVKRVEIPEAYILPQAYLPVVERLQWNGVRMTPLPNDTTLVATCYYIEDYEDGRGPYEGHYLHRNVRIRTSEETLTYYKGDWLIPAEQPAIRFIVNTLEPDAPDAYFAWNFFDGILNQKEYFSAYVFEDLAARYLRQDSLLRRDFDARLKTDPVFREDARAQLDFIYQRSPHYEGTVRRYPVARIMKPAKRTRKR